ncbi:MAG TPA: hypothetical protein VIR55_12255 [Ignavibacteria bacterium]
MKIFLGPIEIAGYLRGLKKGFDENDIQADLVYFYKSSFHSGYESSSSILKIIQFSNSKRAFNCESSFIIKIFWFSLNQLCSIIFLLLSLFKYKYFIFSYGKSILYNNFDLPILKFFKKKIAFIFFGSDARPDYIDGLIINKEFSTNDLKKITNIIDNNIKKKKKLIKKIEKLADFIFCYPTISHFFTKKCINWYLIGFPQIIPNKINLINYNYTTPILSHIPSSPFTKGTKEIRILIEKFKEKQNIIYKEYNNLNSQTLFEIILSSNIIIDQLYSDVPIAGLSLECIRLKKNVVIFGYAQDIWKDYSDRIPIFIYTTPDEFEVVLNKLINNDVLLKEKLLKTNYFFEKHWSTKKVAKKYFDILNNEQFLDISFDPKNTKYIYGCGISKDKLKYFLKNIIEIKGLSILGLSDKPELEKKFIEFAYSDE